MDREYTYCPHCATRLQCNAEKYMQCPACGFIHWNDPKPVAATVVPMAHRFLEIAGIPTAGIPDGGLLLVRRGIEPFAGQWCHTCGHINRYERPKGASIRETNEESGIIVSIEKLLCACNPLPGELNQIVISYLGRPVGGRLKAGSDAMEVGVFDREHMPKLCFRSHQMLADQYWAGAIGPLTGVDLLI